jgi:hypothetical protein
LKNLTKIGIEAQNSDGANVKVSGDVEISSLKGPAQNKRERLWTIPDIMTLTESEYSSRFANYSVPGKERMSEWEVDHSIGKKNLTIDGKDTISLSSLITTPGYYRISWTWKDAKGKTLPISQNVMVYVHNIKSSR